MSTLYFTIFPRNGVKAKQFTYYSIEDLLNGKIEDEDGFNNSFILFKVRLFEFYVLL